MFAHGFAIRFDQIVPPAGVDVGMVAPRAPVTWSAVSLKKAPGCSLPDGG